MILFYEIYFFKILFQAFIEREKHLMHEYVQQHFNQINEDLIFGKFGRPKTTQKKRDYGISLNMITFRHHNDIDFNEYKTLSQVPSLGPEYIEKKFPELSRVIIKYYN